MSAPKLDSLRLSCGRFLVIKMMAPRVSNARLDGSGTRLKKTLFI